MHIRNILNRTRQECGPALDFRDESPHATPETRLGVSTLAGSAVVTGLGMSAEPSRAAHHRCLDLARIICSSSGLRFPALSKISRSPTVCWGGLAEDYSDSNLVSVGQDGPPAAVAPTQYVGPKDDRRPGWKCASIGIPPHLSLPGRSLPASVLLHPTKEKKAMTTPVMHSSERGFGQAAACTAA
jgi:hypothetical protein